MLLIGRSFSLCPGVSVSVSGQVELQPTVGRAKIDQVNRRASGAPRMPDTN